MLESYSNRARIAIVIGSNESIEKGVPGEKPATHHYCLVRNAGRENSRAPGSHRVGLNWSQCQVNTEHFVAEKVVSRDCSFPAVGRRARGLWDLWSVSAGAHLPNDVLPPAAKSASQQLNAGVDGQ